MLHFHTGLSMLVTKDRGRKEDNLIAIYVSIYRKYTFIYMSVLDGFRRNMLAYRLTHILLSGSNQLSKTVRFSVQY